MAGGAGEDRRHAAGGAGAGRAWRARLAPSRAHSHGRGGDRALPRGDRGRGARRASRSSRSWRASSGSAHRAGRPSSRSRPSPATTACSCSPTASAATCRSRPAPTRRRSWARPNALRSRSKASAPTPSPPTPCSGATPSSRSSRRPPSAAPAASCSCAPRIRARPSSRTPATRRSTSASPGWWTSSARSGAASAGSPASARTGATRPDHLARLRELMPRAIFLLPGVGAQGDRVEDLGAAFAPHPAAGLVTASRSIVDAHLERGGTRPRRRRPPRRICARPRWKPARWRIRRGTPPLPYAPRRLPGEPDAAHGRRSPPRLLAPMAILVVAAASPRWCCSTRAWSAARTGRRPAPASPRHPDHRDDQGAGGRRRGVYTVKLNDTLEAIARRRASPSSVSRTLNPEVDPQALVAGQRLKLRE